MKENINRETLVDAIKLSIAADEPILIFGPPGAGKSDTVRAAATACDMVSMDVRAGNIPPEDFAGIGWPDKETGRVVRMMPDIISSAWKMHEETGKAVVIFFDEINHAPLAGQGALYSIVLDRHAANYALPPETRIVAAGNPEGSGSISEAMSRALLDRFFVVNYEGPSPEEFDKFMTETRVNPIVRAFLAENPAMISDFDPDVDVSATPRSWVKLGRLLDNTDSDAMKLRAAQGVVGHAAALQLHAFIEMWGKIPTFNQIVADAAKAKVPNGFSGQYMTAVMLNNKLPAVWSAKAKGSETSFAEAEVGNEAANTRKAIHKAVGSYIMRLSDEVRAMFIANLANSRSAINGGPVTHEVSLFLSEAADTGLREHMDAVVAVSAGAKSVKTGGRRKRRA